MALRALLLLTAITIATTAAANQLGPVPERSEALSAGATSSPATNSEKIFKLSSANMAFERRMEFFLGEALFEKLWVSSPASTKALAMAPLQPDVMLLPILIMPMVMEFRGAPDGNSLANDSLDAGGPTVLRGKQIFHQSGCIACDRPKFVTLGCRIIPSKVSS